MVHRNENKALCISPAGIAPSVPPNHKPVSGNGVGNFPPPPFPPKVKFTKLRHSLYLRQDLTALAKRTILKQEEEKRFFFFGDVLRAQC